MFQRLGQCTIVAVVVVTFAACASLPRKETEVSSDTGRVHIAAFAASVLSSPSFIQASLDKDGLTRTITFYESDDGFAATVDRLPVGDWTLTAFLFDASGDPTHTATKVIRIYPRDDHYVHVVLEPVDAMLEVTVDLTDFPPRDAVEGVRITLSDNKYFSLDPVDEAPYVFHGRRALPAGDYEFSVHLYGPSFYASDRIYQSPWEPVRLHSGKTGQAVWTPALGSTGVYIDVAHMPDAPSRIQCRRDDDGTWIAWDPSTAPADGYVRVYVLRDDFEAYVLMTEAKSDAGEVLVDRRYEQSLAVVLTGVNARGAESFRSEPIDPRGC